MCTNAVSWHKNPLAEAGDSPSAGGLFVGDNFTAAGGAAAATKPQTYEQPLC